MIKTNLSPIKPWAAVTRRPRLKTSRPIQLVVTPGSGNGSALATAGRLREALEARRHATRLAEFPDLDQLRRWAVTTTETFSRLVVVGGDGTQSTAALAAVRRSVPLVPVSRGFGNLFARTFGSSADPDRVADLLAHGRVVRVDVGLCNHELFLCQQSYGLVAQVQERAEAETPRPRARWRRWLGYYRAALGHLRQTLPALRVVVDGRVLIRDAALVTVANVKAYGPWLPVTPEASPVDGLFDVFAMRATHSRQLMIRLLRRHLRLPDPGTGTVLGRGRRVSVTGAPSTRDRLEVWPYRLPVLVSEDTAAALERDRARIQDLAGRDEEVTA
jgi:diacylglycerol kinase family enzyme